MTVSVKTLIRKNKGNRHFFICLKFAKYLKKKNKNKSIFLTNKINNYFKTTLKKNSSSHQIVSSDKNFLEEIKKIKSTKYIIIDDNDVFKESVIKKIIRKTINLTLSEINDDYKKKYEVNILLAQNEQIKKINRKYRKIEKMNNVVSFPQGEIM